MVDSEDEKGRTALCHAARYGSLDCINVLAQHQANAFHTDRDGRTPIDIAEDCSRTEAATQIKRWAFPTLTGPVASHFPPHAAAQLEVHQDKAVA